MSRRLLVAVDVAVGLAVGGAAVWALILRPVFRLLREVATS